MAQYSIKEKKKMWSQNTLFCLICILKQTCFFPIMTPNPLTHPKTQSCDYWGGDTKRGEGGLIKVKKQVDFKVILGDLKYS